MGCEPSYGFLYTLSRRLGNLRDEGKTSTLSFQQHTEEAQHHFELAQFLL